MVFICGVGRSGTSLLQSMLAAHPEIEFLPETAFFRRYVFGGVLEKQMKQGGPPAVMATLSADERFLHLGINAEELVSAIDNFSDLACYQEIVARVAAGQAKWIGDKDPRLVEFLPIVRASFPNAFLLHMVRDPRDVLVSKQKAAWSKMRPWWQHAFANSVQFQMGHSDGATLFGKRYHVIVYEELIATPERVLRELSDKIGIPYADEMVSGFGEAAKRLVRKDEMQWKGETTGPLLHENVNKWRQELTPFQVAFTERLCRPTMRFAGYRAASGLGLVQLAGRLAGSFLSLLALPYRLVRNRQSRRAFQAREQ